jgi:hypothetical protein
VTIKRPGSGMTDGSWMDLKVFFPNLFNIMRKRNSLVKDVINGIYPIYLFVELL